jgi:hypothetical protein
MTCPTADTSIRMGDQMWSRWGCISRVLYLCSYFICRKLYLVVVVVQAWCQCPPASEKMQTKLLGGTHVIVLSLRTACRG